MYRQIIIILSFSLLTACAFFDDKEDSEAWSAERYYTEAKGYLEAGFYARAIEYYTKLESRYPFGKYAQQALLDLAYAHYKSESMDEAIATIDRFIKLYPQNQYVDYAYYLKALANFNRGMSLVKRYLPIDESQRDPASLLQAFRDFVYLLQKFPNSEYAEDSKKRLQYLRNNLAQYEVNVAHYYMRRGAFVAAANRARYVIENYPKTPAVPDALVLMAKTYKVMEMQVLSDDAIRVLQNNYPNHPGIYEVETVQVNP